MSFGPGSSLRSMHEDLRMTGEASTWIAAPTEVVYAAVTDLPRMAEWSPENRGGTWLDGGAPATVGATFLGRNRDGANEWETTIVVSDADPPRRFRFYVDTPGEEGTSWCYTLTSQRGGTSVVETFDWSWTP